VTIPLRAQRRAVPFPCAVLAIALAATAGGASAQSRPPMALPAPATSPAPTALAAAAAQAPAAGVVRELNLTQLGIDYAVQLRGISGTVGIPFNVRADELVTAASLKLNYAYSPSLIPELSHLKVTVNDVLVATLPVNRAEAGKPQTAEIPIDRRLITEFNRINIELIGHYTRDCEDPSHTSLWARIDASSTLKLAVSPLKLTNDLAALPQPFFDRRDVRRARIPFVFGSPETPPVLEAAGVVSSWFGALADYRGATFPVSQRRAAGRTRGGVRHARVEHSQPARCRPSRGPVAGGGRQPARPRRQAAAGDGPQPGRRAAHRRRRAGAEQQGLCRRAARRSRPSRSRPRASRTTRRAGCRATARCSSAS
jgi:hypothetical protein